MNQRLLLTVLALLFIFSSGFSQTPQGINYQAVVRLDNGLMANQVLDAKFTVLKSGGIVYQELHSITTNSHGLFTAVIGTGVGILGTFEQIDWGNGMYQLKVEVNVGNGFQNLGSSQLVSVPYSLYSERARKVDSLMMNDLLDVNAEIPIVGEILKWNGTQWAPANDNVATGGGAVNTAPRLIGDGHYYKSSRYCRSRG